MAHERTPLLKDSQPKTTKHVHTATPKATYLETKTRDLSTSELFSALIFTWIGSFLAASDSTITSTLSATIALDFKSLTIIAWLGSGYLWGMVLVQPVIGKISDIFGRRSCLLVCSLFFAAGNALCGLAITKELLILGRVLAGIGGGGLNCLCTFLTTDLCPPRSIGLWGGLGMIVYGAGIALGGLIGGAINDSFHWRWAFLILTPLTLFCTCGVYLCVPEVSSNQNETTLARIKRIDFLGAFVLLSALGFLLFALNQEEESGGSSYLVLKFALPIFLMLLLMFVAIEIYQAAEPIIPVQLLLNPTVASICLCSFFNSIALYILMFYIPLYFQLQGSSPTEVGLRLLPQSFGISLGSLISGIIIRSTGYCGNLKILNLIIFVLGPIGFVLASLNTSYILPEIYLFVNGFGSGGFFTSMIIALVCAVGQDIQAVATSLMYLSRSIGATLGITISGVCFREILKSRLSKIKLPNPSIGSLYGMSRDCALNGHELMDHDCLEIVQNEYMVAIRVTFLLAFGFSVAGLISGGFVGNFDLASKDAEDLSRDEEVSSSSE